VPYIVMPLVKNAIMNKGNDCSILAFVSTACRSCIDVERSKLKYYTLRIENEILSSLPRLYKMNKNVADVDQAQN